MSLIGWWRLQDSLSAEVGSALVANGVTPVYAIGRFGKGLDRTAELETEKSIYAPFVVPVQGTIELWVKNNGWTWDGTNSSDSLAHAIFAMVAPYNNPRLFALADGLSAHVFQIIMLDQDGHDVTYNLPNTVTLPADTFYHFAMTWDSSYLKIYINNVLVGSTSIGAVVHNGVSSTKLALGSFEYFDYEYGLNGIIDNLKIFDNVKTDFSDSAYETGTPPASSVWSPYTIGGVRIKI
jgi:hypothetical protein